MGCSLVAGIFFAFSAFVIRALQRLPDAQGIAAMQSVNAAVLTPSFLVVFTGTAAACVLLLATAPFTDQPGTAWRVVGALLHLVGVVAVTAGRNVPLNTALDGVEPASSEGARLWEHYLTRWTAWNHVRTVAGTGAVTALALALLG